MTMSNDEYMGRLLRALLDLRQAQLFESLNVEDKRTLVAIEETLHSLINDRVEALDFASQQDATLHAQMVYINLPNLPIKVL